MRLLLPVVALCFLSSCALNPAEASLPEALASARSDGSERVVLIELDTHGNSVNARFANETELNSLDTLEKTPGVLRSALRFDLDSGQVDPLDAGLPWYWLAFGFGAQLVFTARMLLQWIASERAQASVVPTVFWTLSMLGGLMLLTYFLRRGDPVGVLGQGFGLLIYVRNLVFIRRSKDKGAE